MITYSYLIRNKNYILFAAVLLIGSSIWTSDKFDPIIVDRAIDKIKNEQSVPSSLTSIDSRFAGPK